MKVYAAVYETDDGGYYDESDPALVLLVRPSNTDIPAIYLSREQAQAAIDNCQQYHPNVKYRILEVEL